MDSNEGLSRIALCTPGQDPQENLLRSTWCARFVDDLEMLDIKVSENRKLGIVLAGLTDKLHPGAHYSPFSVRFYARRRVLNDTEPLES